MNNFIKIIAILFITSSFFYSCSEPIDINIDDAQKKIVLNSLISTDSTIKLNLTKSIGVLDVDKDFKFISTATVKLFENNIFKEEMQFDTLGYYTSSIYPKIGNTYKVTVKYSPLQSVSATTSIEDVVPISNISNEAFFDERVETWYDSDTEEPFDTTIQSLNNIQVEMSFNDPAETENYYLLTFSALMPEYKSYPPYYEPVFVGYKMTSVDYDTQNMSWENYFSMNNFSGYAISDELFNGSSKTIKAELYMGGNYGMPNAVRVDTVFVNLHSINKEFYQFIISYSKYDDVEGNPFAEPVNIKSNVENGFGFFSGYSTSQDTIIIDYDTNN